MNDTVIGLISGIGSGLVVALANYYFTHRSLLDRLKKEEERNRTALKGKLITDIVATFEEVRINYERIRENKPPDPRFEIRGDETIFLTNILRDLRVHKPLLTEAYYELLMEQHRAAGSLALVINEDQTTWQNTIANWESVQRKIAKKMEAEFYH